MTWRNSVWKRCSAVAVALAVCGLAPAGSVWADEPADPPPTTPDDGQPPDDGPAPETGLLDAATVAVGPPPLLPVPPVPPVPPADDMAEVVVGRPPVPPVSDVAEVAVGRPPVPPAGLIATVSAALDIVAACL